MQFKVPQDVLRADKIVAFLTLRQLLICTLGGTLTYVLYTILARHYFIQVWLIPVLLTALITMAFAFVRPYDIPFEKVILLFIEYNFRPRKRFWQKMEGDVNFSVFLSLPKEQAKAPKSTETQASRRKKLQEVSLIVDSRGKPPITATSTPLTPTPPKTN